MTIQNLYDKIVSWPENTMNFTITDVFSWRGVYAEPACSIECKLTSKEHNLNMLARLLNETFCGWKGGKCIIHHHGKYFTIKDWNMALNEGIKEVIKLLKEEK